MYTYRLKQNIIVNVYVSAKWENNDFLSVCVLCRP